MKSAHTILSHLSSQPQFRFLKRHACYQKYISLLGEKYRKAIAFVYIRQETLYVAVTHPGFKMELNYNRDLLKDVLTHFANYTPECGELKADKVVVFHSRYHPLTTPPVPETVPHFTELATGTFPVKSDTPELIEQFERIKTTIGRNR
ncbi:MAG TPA: DUF721 domain-containing protein [Epsilonproteobacteria bacterium]|nr:DUF721 domain-containing protein [Campylobacterota bacterium]